jgi:hypothetical protein
MLSLLTDHLAQNANHLITEVMIGGKQNRVVKYAS